MKRSISVFLICLSLLLNTTLAADNKKYSFQTALSLYNQHAFAESANAFDQVLSNSLTNANLCYYAALANWQCHRIVRANQLFTYIVTNFSGSQEATYAQRMLSSQAKKTQVSETTDNENELPATIKNGLPSDMRALLQTDAGKAVLKQFMKEQSANLEVIRNAEQQGTLPTHSLLPQNAPVRPQHSTGNERPFSAADIARDGAGGIDQSRYPNCWFEASMSALAQLPRGQKLLADTIRYGLTGGYIVRFKNDGVEYKVSEEDMANSGIYDKALWASIIENAELKKFPNNAGANGSDADQSRLEIGLGSITGCKAEVIYPSSCDTQELSAFIGGAVKSQNPIVAATFGIPQLMSVTPLVIPSHAYSIIDFDPSKQLVTIRNPHGSRSQRFQLPSDPQHLEFEQLNDGLFKMSLSNVQKYFHSLARSFI